MAFEAMFQPIQIGKLTIRNLSLIHISEPTRRTPSVM
jgi:hypothetical protein